MGKLIQTTHWIAETRHYVTKNIHWDKCFDFNTGVKTGDRPQFPTYFPWSVPVLFAILYRLVHNSI